MRWVMIDTGERVSHRFERLCEALETSTQEDEDRVFTALVLWYLRWSGDQETDSGILVDVSERRLGQWAEWSQPLAFGRALVKAGYVRSLADSYPEQLVVGLQGWVVPGALELSWDGVHRKRSDRSRLALFILDPVRRWNACLACGVDPATAPEGWLKPPPDQGDGWGPSGNASGKPPGNPSGNAGGKGSAAPPLPPRVREHVNVKEEKEMFQRTATGRTANTKTLGQRDFIRENKYTAPLDCLYELDNTSDAARAIWSRAVREIPEHVMRVLAELTETDEAWAGVSNPAALVMSRLKGALGKHGRVRAYGNGRGGSGGAAEVIPMPSAAAGGA